MSDTTPLAQRLHDAVTINPETGCWEFDNYDRHSGYGRIRVNGRQMRAHRVAYETFVGPIPDGYFICHHCDNRACINPEHIYAGTPADNSRDAVARGRLIKNQCLRAGHPLTEGNLIVDTSDGQRRCKACRRAAGQRYKQRQRELQAQEVKP